MTSLEDFRKQKADKSQAGVTVSDALEARKKATGKTLAEFRDEMSEYRSKQRQDLVADVTQSATLTTQEQMLAEIKAGTSIDDVLAKYGVQPQ